MASVPAVLNRPIRVLLVDDHPAVRDGVAAQLQPDHDLQVVGHAGTAADAVAACTVEQPDIVLLDLRLPDVIPAELVPRLHAACRRAKVVLFTAFPHHATVAATLAAGACGLLVKDLTGPRLRDALHEVARAGTLSPRRPRSQRDAAPISPREYDVLRLVAAGHTNPEIGVELGLSLNTVKTYLSNVMGKLDACNRTQVVTRARERGLL